MDLSKNQTAYLVNPLDIYIGSRNKEVHNRRISRLRASEIASVRTDRLYYQLESSGLRDKRGSRYIYLFLAKALAEAKVSVAYIDKDCKRLTSHSNRYFKFYDFRDLAPEAPLLEDLDVPLLYAPPGSLAFYLTRYPELNDPSIEIYDLLISILSKFWEEQGLSIYTPLSQRYQSILHKYNIDYTLLRYVGEKLTKRLSKSHTLRRWSVSKEDLSESNFPQVFEFSQYSEAILTEWELVQRAANMSQDFADQYGIERNKDPFYLTASAKRLLRLAPPAGIALIYQAIVVELYLNIVSQFYSLEESVLQLPIGGFGKHKDVQQVIPEIVGSMAGIYDAYDKLSIIKGLENIGNKSILTYDGIRRWMLSGNLDSVPRNDYRIGKTDLQLQVNSIKEGHPFQVYNNWRANSTDVSKRLIISTERSVINTTLLLDVNYLFVPSLEKPKLNKEDILEEQLWIIVITEDLYIQPRSYSILLGQSKQITLNLINKDYGVIIATIGSKDLDKAIVTSNAVVYQNYRNIG